MTLYDGVEFGYIGRVGGSCEACCGDELVGETAEGRHHHHNGLVGLIGQISGHNLFYIGETLNGAYRSAAKFQYLHYIEKRV